MSREAGSGAEAPDLKAAGVQGVRWSLIARGTAEAIAFASMLVLARLIPPAEVGRVAVALIVQELAVFFPSEGVGSALVQRKEVTRKHLQAGFALALLAAVVLALLTLGASSAIVSPIFGTRTADLVRLSTPLFLIVAVGCVPSALLRRRLAFRRASMVDMVTALVRAGACVGLALAGLDGEALVLGTLAGAAAGVTVAFASAPAPPPRLERAAARDVLNYGLPASLASVSWVGFRNCDYAIVGARLGAAQAGFYFRGYQLGVEYQKKISLLLGQVGFPLLSRTRNADQMNSVRMHMVRLLTLVLFPLLALLAVVAPVLVPWLLGPTWEPAVLPTQILALGGASVLAIDAAGTVLMAAGRPRALLGYGVAHFLVYALAVFVVAPLGLTAVAVSAAVVHTLFLVVAYMLMLHGSGEPALRRLWDDIGPATVSSLGLLAAAVPASRALTAAGLPAVPWLLGVTAAAAPAYLLTVRAAFPASWHSMAEIARRVLSGHRRVVRSRRAPLADSVSSEQVA